MMVNGLFSLQCHPSSRLGFTEPEIGEANVAEMQGELDYSAGRSIIVSLSIKTDGETMLPITSPKVEG